MKFITDLDKGAVAYLMKCFNGNADADTFRGIFNEIESAIDVVVDGVLDIQDGERVGGHESGPIFELAIRERSKPYSDKPAVDHAYRLIWAMTRDITEELHEQIEYRRKRAGNIVLEWCGPTGMTKSSCMMGLAERHNRLLDIVREGGPDALERHLTIDIAELPAKLPKLKRGEAILMDEQLSLVGEGSETARHLLSNLEDTIRQTGVDVHFASPGVREGHATSQGILEAIAVDYNKHTTRFLYSLAYGTPRPLPLGVVELPWCSKEVYEAYKPIKERNLARTMRLQFHAAGEVDDGEVKSLFSNEKLRALLKHKARVTKTDWKRYIRRFLRSMSTSEADNMAGELEEMLSILRDAPADFVTIYGWEPTAEMQAVALGKNEARRHGP